MILMITLQLIMVQDNKWKYNKNAWNNFIDNSINTTVLPENKLEELPSILSDIFPLLSNIILNYDCRQEEVSYNIPFEIEDKIKHNNIEKYKTYLEDYWSYILPIEEYLDLLDENIPWRKNHFLSKIKRIYLDILYELNTKKEDRILFIKKVTGDLIIDKVIETIYKKYLNSPNRSNKYTEEDIEVSIIVTVCKSFVECKILENPNI